MSELKVKRFPEDMSALEIDKTDPARCLVSGLFQEQTRVGGEVRVISGTCKEIVGGVPRTFYTYIPEKLAYDRPCLVIVPPSGTEPCSFLEGTGLRAFADQNQVFLHLLQSEGDGWELTGADADFVNAVYIQIQSRDFYVTMQDNIYCVGIGDGATVAHQAVMKSTSEWSGLATFGQLDDAAILLNADVTSGVGGQDHEMMLQGAKCQIPVWMVFDQSGSGEEKAIRYWQKQNNVDETALAGGGADEIYLPSRVWKGGNVNEENISQVRVTRHVKTFDRSVFETIWNYVGAARRHRSFGKKDLRYFKSPLEYGATLHTMEHCGYVRRWYEYVPEAVKREGTPVPVVVCMHGRGGSAETFFDISGLSVVAEERKFIAVFPDAGLFQQKPPTGLKNVLLWNIKDFDDVGFIRRIIEELKLRQPVDIGRIYCCGQSSGGVMSTELALQASDLFAAAAPWSGVSALDPGKDLTDPKVPLFLMRGEKDGQPTKEDDFPFAVNERWRKFLHFYMERVGILPECSEYESGIYHYYEYRNADGVPMLTFVEVRDMPHANVPEMSWLSYDLSLSRYRRGEDGTLYYMGRPVR